MTLVIAKERRDCDNLSSDHHPPAQYCPPDEDKGNENGAWASKRFFERRHSAQAPGRNDYHVYYYTSTTQDLYSMHVTALNSSFRLTCNYQVNEAEV